MCENVGDHLLGNLYVMFKEEEAAESAKKSVKGRFYAKRPVLCEYSPVTDFRDAHCRQHERKQCNRGGFCNFLHLKQPSSDVKDFLGLALRSATGERASAGREYSPPVRDREYDHHRQDYGRGRGRDRGGGGSYRERDLDRRHYHEDRRDDSRSHRNHPYTRPYDRQAPRHYERERSYDRDDDRHYAARNGRDFSPPPRRQAHEARDRHDDTYFRERRERGERHRRDEGSPEPLERKRSRTAGEGPPEGRGEW